MFFKKWFATKEKVDIDLSVLQIDIHSHLIPGIDDGSKSVEDSLNMLHAFVELGYKKVITTPHIMGDFYKNTPSTILSGLEEVRAAMLKDERLKDLKIEAAAEYYFDAEFEQKIHNEKLLTFGDKYLLFEVSYLNEPDGINNIIFQMQTHGYKPVLAHPERYPFWHNKFDKYQEFVDKGVLLQLNTNSLTGHYGPMVKKVAEQLIDANLISFIGSDCHKIEHIGVTKRIKQSLHLKKLIESGKLLNQTL